MPRPTLEIPRIKNGNGRYGVKELVAILTLFALVGGAVAWAYSLAQNAPATALKYHRERSLKTAHSEAVSRYELTAKFTKVDSRLERIEEANIIIAVDTSGSITQPDYNVFMSECIAIMKSLDYVQATLLFWHTSVYKEIEITSKTYNQIKNIPDMEGGGTMINLVAAEDEEATIPYLSAAAAVEAFSHASAEEFAALNIQVHTLRTTSRPDSIRKALLPLLSLETVRRD